MASNPPRRNSVSAARPPDETWGGSDSEDEVPFSSSSSSADLLLSSNTQVPALSSNSSLLHPQPSPAPITHANNPSLSTNSDNTGQNSFHGKSGLVRLDAEPLPSMPAPHPNPIFGPVAAPPPWPQAATRPTHMDLVAPFLIFPQGNLNPLDQRSSSSSGQLRPDVEEQCSPHGTWWNNPPGNSQQTPTTNPTTIPYSSIYQITPRPSSAPGIAPFPPHIQNHFQNRPSAQPLPGQGGGRGHLPLNPTSVHARADASSSRSSILAQARHRGDVALSDDREVDAILHELMDDDNSDIAEGAVLALSAPRSGRAGPTSSSIPNSMSSSMSRNAHNALGVALSRLAEMRAQSSHQLNIGGTPEENLARRIDYCDALSGILRSLSIPLDVKTAFAYIVEPAPTGTDVWPDIRDRSKVPVKYTPIQLVLDRKAKFNFLQQNTSENSSSPYVSPHHGATVWPMQRLPSELYASIMSYLSRDDIKAMRLTCKEFEHYVSHALFESVVLPFNTEIYGMLQATQNAKVNAKGKGKAKSGDSVSAGLSWQNANDDDIYTGHGINVFKGFGPHIKKYGMSFEVSEESLANPPLKGTREAQKSYWGEYHWPYQEYQRFDEVAGLETAADETFKMKTAFSFLREVKELALSIDSGLGYLHGPDTCLRTELFRKRPPVFGMSRDVPDRKEQANSEFWEHLKRAYGDGTTGELQHIALVHCTADITREDWTRLAQDYAAAQIHRPQMPFINLLQLVDRSKWPDRDCSDEVGVVDKKNPKKIYDDPGREHAISSMQHSPFSSGIVMAKEDTNDVDKFETAPVLPFDLKKLQREWLLETEWAQIAFLSSYMIAIVDNPIAFRNVHTMNIARISSKYIISICRNDFWDALPKLKNIKVHVIPDWRNVNKDQASFVETHPILPSRAALTFHKLLSDIIAPMRKVTSLDIGWAAGGERERGIYGRNKHLMPAPVLPYEWLSTMMSDHQELANSMVRLRHIEHLTLSNCWITPGALEILVVTHQHEALKKLTLDSVSLTAVLRVTGQNNGANNNVQPAAPPVANPPVLNANAQAAAMPQWNLGHAVAAQANGILPAPGANAINAWQQPAGQFQVPPPATIPPLHQPQNQPQPAANPGNINVSFTINGSWLGPHRTGSWPWILDKISPGPTLVPHGSKNSPPSIMTPSCDLQSIEMRSCGYARLSSTLFDQSGIDVPAAAAFKTAWFTKRESALSGFMMQAHDPLLGEVVQYMPPAELQALVSEWDCRLGGEDWGEEEREAPTFDGCLLGGTGRFSGLIVRRIGGVEMEE